MGKILSIRGTHDENTLAQFNAVLDHPKAMAGALMADGHLGYIMPVGGVVAYRDAISVAGVGYDIGCGNFAVETNMGVGGLTTKDLNDLADRIKSEVSFGLGRFNDDKSASDFAETCEWFAHPAWWTIPQVHRGKLWQRALAQFGTVGSGNHFVDVFFSEKSSRLWVGVHFGSRGLGHWIASSFLSLASGGDWGDRVPEFDAVLDVDSGLGIDYIGLMQMAGNYAATARQWVATKVARMIGDTLTTVSNHHNFAWKEYHNLGGGAVEGLWVVRKGATPAFPGQSCFVGGSMGDVSVILQGVETPDSPSVLYSTVHGAGRVMSRTAARGKVNRKTGEVKSTGKVSKSDMDEWLSREGVILRGGGVDESPHVYRRLPDVLVAQGETIRVLEVLHPLIVIMAGADEFDPYKD